MSDTEATALASFTGKWRARWPEWSVAEVFLPPAQREAALAWAALLQELTDAAWGGSDARPGEAKLAWWIEELQGWSQGRRRHPLGSALQRLSAPWAGLAAALPSLRDSRERPLDIDDAFAGLDAFSLAVTAVESSLFAGGEGTSVPPAKLPPAKLIAATLLQTRLAHHPSDAVPLRVLAQAGEGGGAAIWARQLAQGDWTATGSTRPRRMWAALARARLQRGDAMRPLPSWAALWAAWRSAR